MFCFYPFLLPILSANASPYKADSILKPNIKARSRNRFCSGTAIRIRYSKCVFVVLLIQHAMRIRHMFSPVACLVLQYFYTSTINGAIFEGSYGR